MSIGKKIGVLPMLLVAVLSFGGFMGVAAVVSQNGSNFIPVSLADEGEDGDDDEDKDDDKDDDKDKKDVKNKDDDKDDEEDSKDDSDEDEDKNDNDSDEDESGDKDGDDNDSDENEGDDIDDEDEDGDNNGMYKDQAKTVSKLEKIIAEAEKDILEKQAEGVDVTAALARLALAKAAVGSVNGAFDSNDLEAAKRLSKEVKKLAHFAKEEDLHDAKEVAEDVAKVSKRITQAYGKIALLEAVGGDGSSLKATLSSLEADLDALKGTIAAGGYNPETMSDALEALERKVKSVKSSAEKAIYALGGTDDELDDDLEDESDDVAEHLNDVADIEEDNVGRTIRQIGEDHKGATKKVSEAVKNVDKRNVILQTLFGADESTLRDLELEVAGNKARTEALLQAANTIEDQDVKAILLNQVAVLKEQAAKLEVFVSGQRDRLSIFGWFFNLGK